MATPADLNTLEWFDFNDVKAYTRLARSTLNALVREDNFPAPQQFNNRKRYWRAAVVRAWFEEQLEGAA